jgi:glycosyltransferase involved in cell wall biosynthesis
MKFAIIMPTYNRAHTILRAVDSVLAQTHINWELIIRDDGSKDDTAQILQSKLSDTRIRYLPRAENKGVNTTRNEAIAAISDDTDIVTFLDSDDTLKPEALSTACLVLEQHPEWLWVNFTAEDEAGHARSYLKPSITQANRQEFITDTGIEGEFVQFLRRECAQKLHFVDGINGYESIGWIELASQYTCHFRPESLRVYWQDTESLIRTKHKSEGYYRNQKIGLETYMQRYGNELTQLNRNSAALNWFVLGHAQAMLGECPAAIHSTITGIKLDWRNLRFVRNILSIIRCWLRTKKGS